MSHGKLTNSLSKVTFGLALFYCVNFTCSTPLNENGTDPLDALSNTVAKHLQQVQHRKLTTPSTVSLIPHREWSSWSECSQLCGLGSQKRHQRCIPSGSDCGDMDRMNEVRLCQGDVNKCAQRAYMESVLFRKIDVEKDRSHTVHLICYIAISVIGVVSLGLALGIFLRIRAFGEDKKDEVNYRMSETSLIQNSPDVEIGVVNTGYVPVHDSVPLAHMSSHTTTAVMATVME